MPSSRVTVGYSPDREPDPVPPYTGLVADQPKVFTFAPSPRGSRPPSFFSRTKPSSAMSSHSALASLMLPSLMSPPPRRAMLTMPYMGPVRIRLTMITRATTKAIHALPRTRPFRGFWSLMAAMVATMASTRTTAMAIRCPCIKPIAFFTSSMLMPNIVLPPHSLFGGRFPPVRTVYHSFSACGVDLRKLRVFSFNLHSALAIPHNTSPRVFGKVNNAGA